VASDAPDLEPREQADTMIRLAIENELLGSEAVAGHRIDVTVEDGIVTLSGLVDHLLEKQIAAGLAQRVRGVVSVVDQMEFRGERRADADLQRDVHAALAADPDTHQVVVAVEVKDGVVTLTGDVSSYGLKLLAERVASAVKGVTQVVNNLGAASNEILSDEALQQELGELYRYSVQLDTAKIEVQVAGGRVVLEGEVASSFQRSIAQQLAFQTGAKTVDARGLRIHWRHDAGLLRAERYEHATDADIRAAVLRAMKYDPRLLSFDPGVEVAQGTVKLSGTVGHLAAKQAAERVARYTIGVREVENELQIRWPDEPPSDEQIAQFTREALRRDPYIEAENVMVECDNAHVELYGVVDTQFEKYHAEWTASGQQGVVHVDNNLSIRQAWKPQSDATIEANLKERLALLFTDEENVVSVKVRNGVAMLEGEVDTWFMWQSAVDAALAAGAREPHVMIQVRYGLPSAPQYYGPHDYIPK
jgi:osmotically-inducible protein OsmY